LGVASETAVNKALDDACEFAISRGPVAPWLAAAKRLRRSMVSADLLWTLCRLAERVGELDTALDAAQELARLARTKDDDRSRARALGMVADILAARGELDEALRIRRDEELPVY